MLIIWLAVFISYKNINSFSSYAESWDGIPFKPITENSKTNRQKPSRSYMSNPLFSSKEITESIFPDVIYPTSILDVREPFYFTTTGFDDLLKPFSDDVKSSYKALNSEKESKNNFAKHKLHSIQNIKNSNKNLKDPILQKNYINNSKVLNVADDAIQQNNKTKFDIDAINYNLINLKDDTEYQNISYNLDNVNNNTFLQEIMLPLEIATCISQCIQDYTTNDENLNTQAISDNVEECIILKGFNKTEIKSDINVTVTGEGYDPKVYSDYVEECVILKEFNKTEINGDVIILVISENNNNTKEVSNNVEECVNIELNKTEFNDTVIITVISKNCNLTSNDTNCFEWTKYDNEKFEDDFNHFMEYGINNITKLEFLRKLLKTKSIFNSILHVLHNFNDTDHVFLNSSLVKMDTIIEDGQLKDYYDCVVGNSSLRELFLESETEAISSIMDKFSEICGKVEEETIVKDDLPLDIINGTSDDVINSSEISCTLKYDKRNEFNEINSIDDVVFDIIDIICDYPEETYVKSSASSILSTFDGFKSNKNPFVILFHHFPSSTISDS